MPTVADASILLALKNIVHFGDTDVFPLPLERHWFEEDEPGVLAVLRNFDVRFDETVGSYPVTFEKVLTGVGYNGFRAATQIDPLWNAYLLALVIELAPHIEAARVPVERNTVFSYRYLPDLESGGLFSKTEGWRSFQERALALASDAKFVLATDISDFYQRIYHHRLENALQLAAPNKEAAKRVQVILFKLAGGTSYGLPIGGNAARLLAELLLNRVDRLLLASSVTFCRFVDDYLIFAKTREEAQRALVTLSDSLMRNEGLTLSRNKSRLMSASEFRRASPLAELEHSDSAEEQRAKRFLRIRWNYDPYSPTAPEDYHKLVDEVAGFDVLSMLATEFRKARVDESLVRQLVRSIVFLDPPLRDGAALSLVENLQTLYPVFPTVARVLRKILPDVSPEAKARILLELRGLLRSGSHIMMVPSNALYAVRLLANDPSEEVDVLYTQLYQAPTTDSLLRRDIIYSMTKRGAHYWLSDLLKRNAQLASWERRALLAASFSLGDEGKHWRAQREAELSEIERAYRRWLGIKNNGAPWDIPI
jgi:hypothetical protein